MPLGPSPDRSFMRSLESLDKRLGIKWNGSHFVITYKRPVGEPANIHLVRTGDGGFRQPDQRDLDYICSGDLERESLEDKLNRLACHSEQVREKCRKDAHDNIRDMTKDNKNQLRKAIGDANNLPGNSASYRQVPYKPKGKVYGG